TEHVGVVRKESWNEAAAQYAASFLFEPTSDSIASARRAFQLLCVSLLLFCCSAGILLVSFSWSNVVAQEFQRYALVFYAVQGGALAALLWSERLQERW